MDKKMSKSSGNTILLSDLPETIHSKMRTAVTDPLKVRKHDPGRPDICLVYTYHQKFNPAGAPDVHATCTSGELGCVECKKRIAGAIAEHLAPFREKRAHFEAHPLEVREILEDGERRARARAQATMAEVRTVMNLG
jgi:tryptophanyl-tRNA synthetase